MSQNTFSRFKLNDLFNLANRLATIKDNPEIGSDLPHRVARHILKQSPRSHSIELIETSPSMNELFSTNDPISYLDNCWGGICSNDTEITNIYFIDKIVEYILQKKFIFVFLGLDEYIIEEDAKTCYNKHVVSHATTLIFWPMKENTYGVYHFNPHGHFSSDILYYEKYITKYRKKEISLKLPLDVWVVKKIISAIHRAITYVNPKTSLQFSYDNTNAHNYYGPNLQIADKFGLCLIYQFLLFEFICTNHDPSHVLFMQDNIKARRFPGTDRLMQRGDWTTLIYICLDYASRDCSSSRHQIRSSRTITRYTLRDIVCLRELYGDEWFINEYENRLTRNNARITRNLLQSYIIIFKNQNIIEANEVFE